jgi:hypothetical protein
MDKVTQIYAITQEIFDIGFESFNVTPTSVCTACAGCVKAHPNFSKFGFCALFINSLALSRV